MEFEKELIDILDHYTENNWREEPLNGDEVDILVEHLKNQLNLINGNITQEEYDKLENFMRINNKEEHICSLCGEKFYGMGNNPEPLKKYEERCCDKCNETLVIPKRIEMWEQKEKQ